MKQNALHEDGSDGEKEAEDAEGKRERDQPQDKLQCAREEEQTRREKWLHCDKLQR